MESSNRRDKEPVYDEFRKLWVVKTPEEEVRQKVLKKMTGELSYPRGLISVEKSLSELLPHSSVGLPLRRLDIVCLAKGTRTGSSLYPLLVIECKEASFLLDEALEQVKGYNHFLKACFIAAVAPDEERFGIYCREGMHFLSYIPRYSDLIRLVAADDI